MNLSTTNTLDMDERVRLGKQREEQILALLENEDIKLEGKWFSSWVESDADTDMRDKIDATVMWGSTETPVQIKYRDRGRDIGVACVRPYVDHKTFQKQWQAGSVPWDRDMRSLAKLLVCLSSDGGVLTIVKMETIETGVHKMLGAFAGASGFVGTSFTNSKFRGAEIKIVRDKGKGYSAGQQKLVCYFTPELLEAAGGWVKNYYGSPEEMEPGR